jgi:REP element-mobilizing transposase RayT
MNVQADHVPMIVQIRPKLSISEYMGRLKGKSAIRAKAKAPPWAGDCLLVVICIHYVTAP